MLRVRLGLKARRVVRARPGPKAIRDLKDPKARKARKVPQVALLQQLLLILK